MRKSHQKSQVSSNRQKATDRAKKDIENRGHVAKAMGAICRLAVYTLIDVRRDSLDQIFPKSDLFVAKNIFDAFHTLG